MDHFPTIHVHTQSDKNTIPYVRFMWETMRSLANHPSTLKLSVHCMGPTAVDKLAMLPAATTYVVPNIAGTDCLNGSQGHAACVERAIAMTDDGDIHIIADSDTVVVAKGWDDYVRCELLDKRVGLIGTTYEDIGGFSSGNSIAQTYKKVPNVVWMAMSPLHSWKDLKAMPVKADELHITNENMSRIYNLPVGYQVFRDIAWQIPEYLASRGINYVGWKLLKAKNGATVLHDLNEYHEEYHVTADGIPFVLHHRGSMKHAYRSSGISAAFYERVDSYLLSETQRSTRWLWQLRPENASTLASIKPIPKITTPHIEVINVPQVVLPVQPQQAQPQSQPRVEQPQPWLKATLNGNNVWSRYSLPVPQPVEISDKLVDVNHLRLEGTIVNAKIMLPAFEKQCMLTVRNATCGHASIGSSDGRTILTIPQETCWSVLVDADGPVHVQ